MTMIMEMEYENVIFRPKWISLSLVSCISTGMFNLNVKGTVPRILQKRKGQTSLQITLLFVVMDQNHDWSKNNANIETSARVTTDQGKRSNKCNQCAYASSYASHLRTHLKTHNGEKPNKCNQCNYASSQAGNW